MEEPISKKQKLEANLNAEPVSSQTQLEISRKQLDIYADDSSDEEDEGSYNRVESLVNEWESFKNDKLKDINNILKNILEYQIRNSFRVTYLGITLLHTPGIQALYQQNKEKYLAGNTLNVTDTEIEKLVKMAINNAIEQIFGKSIVENSTDGIIAKILSNKTIQALIDEIVKELIKDKRVLLKSMNNPSEIRRQFKKLEELKEKLKVYLPEMDNINHNFQPRKNIKYNNSYKNLNKIVLDLLVKEIEERVKIAENEIKEKSTIGLFALHKYLQANNEALLGIEEELLLIFEEEEYAINTQITEYEDDIRLLGIDDFVERYKEELLPTMFDYLNIQEQSSASSEFFHGTSLWKLYNDPYLSKEIRNQILPYVAWTIPRVKSFINDNLGFYRYYEIISGQIFSFCGNMIERSCLKRGLIFKADSTLTFFSSLRTVSRSQTRMIRHLKTHKLIGGDKASQNWQFNDGYAHDDLVINLNYGRVDITSAVGTYEKNYENIVTLKNDLQIDDKDIAILIRKILTGDGLGQFAVNHEKYDSYKAFLVNLTYLLFGSEAVRNPSSFILHQMMLDLIIAGKLNWQEAFTGKEKKNGGGGHMPMSMEHAVSISRWLSNQFEGYMPYHYLYEGHSINLDVKSLAFISEFIARQSALIESWYSYQISRINNQYQNIPERLDLIIEHIEKHWYPNICLNNQVDTNPTNIAFQ